MRRRGWPGAPWGRPWKVAQKAGCCFYGMWRVAAGREGAGRMGAACRVSCLAVCGTSITVAGGRRLRPFVLEQGRRGEREGPWARHSDALHG